MSTRKGRGKKVRELEAENAKLRAEVQRIAARVLEQKEGRPFATYEEPGEGWLGQNSTTGLKIGGVWVGLISMWNAEQTVAQINIAHAAAQLTDEQRDRWGVMLDHMLSAGGERSEFAEELGRAMGLELAPKKPDVARLERREPVLDLSDGHGRPFLARMLSGGPDLDARVVSVSIEAQNDWAPVDAGVDFTRSFAGGAPPSIHATVRLALTDRPGHPTTTRARILFYGGTPPASASDKIPRGSPVLAVADNAEFAPNVSPPDPVRVDARVMRAGFVTFCRIVTHDGISLAQMLVRTAAGEELPRCDVGDSFTFTPEQGLLQQR